MEEKQGKEGGEEELVPGRVQHRRRQDSRRRRQAAAQQAGAQKEVHCKKVDGLRFFRKEGILSMLNFFRFEGCAECRVCII